MEISSQYAVRLRSWLPIRWRVVSKLSTLVSSVCTDWDDRPWRKIVCMSHWGGISSAFSRELRLGVAKENRRVKSKNTCCTRPTSNSACLLHFGILRCRWRARLIWYKSAHLICSFFSVFACGYIALHCTNRYSNSNNSDDNNIHNKKSLSRSLCRYLYLFLYLSVSVYVYRPCLSQSLFLNVCLLLCMTFNYLT